MVTVVRKSISSFAESRRDVFSTVSWQIRTNIWTPPTDIFETDQHYIVRVEVAGMRDTNFEISVDHNVIYISGNRPSLPGRGAYHQMEIRFGKFFTSISLPGPVNVDDDARAEYDDGFLTIKLPKLLPSNIKVK